MNVESSSYRRTSVIDEWLLGKEEDELMGGVLMTEQDIDDDVSRTIWSRMFGKMESGSIRGGALLILSACL